LTADLLRLGSEVEILEANGVRLLHVDVMDGCFTPMMTVGPPLIKALRTSLLKDVHLMIEEPLNKVADYVAAGADMITVHVESSRHIHRVLQQMRSMVNTNDAGRGIVRGVALNPGTPLESIEPLLDEVDAIFLLAVNPGWGGQRFIESTAPRAAAVREFIARSPRPILLGIDGGVTAANVERVAALGADIIVTGSAVFDGKAAAENARALLSKVRGQPTEPGATRPP
jgi:ribulose-phosphate 3-epimerase